MKLLTSQKDALFDIIEKKRLSPTQFIFSDRQSKYEMGQTTCLNHIDSKYYFSFEIDPVSNFHYAIYSPGRDKFVDEFYGEIWDNQLRYFEIWLQYLIREIKAPNKWERLKKEIEGLSINYEGDEDKFSAHEYEDLKSKIALLKQNVTKIGLPTNQITAIHTKLDHLKELAKEMNKFDWKSLFIGTIMSIIIQLSVTQENAKTLWEIIKQVFNNYFLP